MLRQATKKLRRLCTKHQSYPIWLGDNHTSHGWDFGPFSTPCSASPTHVYQTFQTPLPVAKLSKTTIKNVQFHDPFRSVNIPGEMVEVLLASIVTKTALKCRYKCCTTATLLFRLVSPRRHFVQSLQTDREANKNCYYFPNLLLRFSAFNRRIYTHIFKTYSVMNNLEYFTSTY